MFRARLRARLCRGKEGLHRAPTFVRQFGGYTHILLLFLSSIHYCPLFHPLLSDISSSSCKDLARGSAGSKTPGVVTICGWSAAGRRPTPGLQQQLQGSCARVRRIQNARITICGWSVAGRRPTPGLQQQLQGSCARVRRIQNARRRSRARSLRNLLVSGNECGRVFPAGVGPGSPSRDAANWLPSRFSLSVETRRRYGWLRMMVFPGARLFPSPNLMPFGRVAARERQGALSRRAW